MEELQTAQIRTLFLSDLHLGYWVSKGEEAISVLTSLDFDRVYLVGDVVDESRLKRRWYWPQHHQQVVDKFLELGAKNKVLAVPGNHDTYLRETNWEPNNEDNSELNNLLSRMKKLEHQESFDFEWRDGRKFLVTHGDLYDKIEKKLFGIPKLGSRVFDRINWVMPRFLVHALRSFFKLIFTTPSKIEQRLVDSAKSRGYDGVIFGHLHEPKLDRQSDGFIVANCGDWMTNQSYLVETIAGDLELWNFKKLVKSLTNPE